MRARDGKQEFNSEFLEKTSSHPTANRRPCGTTGSSSAEKKARSRTRNDEVQNRRERFDLRPDSRVCVVLCCVCVNVCEVQLLKAPEESLSLRLFTSTRAVYLTPDDLDA